MLLEQKQSMETQTTGMRMLANFDLDVEELEQRLELATALHVDCYSDNCGANCPSNCVSNCATNNGCTTNYCSTDTTGCSSHCC